MSNETRVYLITGFLGSGKTTLLNRIIDRFPKDQKLTLLVNEFGEIGVDGTLVEGEDIDMMEISKGSIFCVCVKTDFIKGLYELNTTVQPDVLLIESTGVANPSDLKKDLKAEKNIKKRARGAYGRAVKLMLDVDKLKGRKYFPERYFEVLCLSGSYCRRNILWYRSFHARQNLFIHHPFISNFCGCGFFLWFLRFHLNHNP